MAYTHVNFKTKKALAEAIKAGKEITCYQEGPFGPDLKDGVVFLEGPHFPEPHKWYAQAECKNGRVIRVIK